MVQQYKAYVTADSFIDGENKPKLLLRVYEKLLLGLDTAKVAIERKDFEKKHTSLSNVRILIGALDSSLDMSYGEIPQNLSALYKYLLKRVADVNQNLDVTILDECKKLVRILFEGFSEAYELEKGIEKRKEGSISAPTTNQVRTV